MFIKRFFYHGMTPFIYSLILSFVFRYGEIFQGYCGHAAVFLMLLFILFSFIFDHKEEILDVLLWTFVRLYLYTGIAVLLAIFQKEIFRYIQG